MRRTILLISVLIGGIHVFADDPKESKARYYRHEVNVSLSGMFMPSSQWDDYEKKVYQAMVYERDHDNGYRLFGPSSSGPLISYYYHLNHRIAIGAMAAFTTHHTSLGNDYRTPIETPYEYWDSKEQTTKVGYRTEYTTQYISAGEIKEKSFFLMPSLKWSWLNNSWCSLYMKASVGLHYQQKKADVEKIPLKNEDDLDESKLRFAYLAAPFGWEIGKQKVRGFLEFGLGSNVNLQIGLTYRFGRY